LIHSAAAMIDRRLMFGASYATVCCRWNGWSNLRCLVRDGLFVEWVNYPGCGRWWCDDVDEPECSQPGDQPSKQWREQFQRDHCKRRVS
jgi:hypothetical protein